MRTAIQLRDGRGDAGSHVDHRALRPHGQVGGASANGAPKLEHERLEIEQVGDEVAVEVRHHGRHAGARGRRAKQLDLWAARDRRASEPPPACYDPAPNIPEMDTA